MVRSRHAAVDGRLQQHFTELVFGDAIAKRRAQMQRQLLRTIERDHHCHRDAAASPPVQPGPAPDLTPGVAREQILKIARKLRRSGRRAIDVLVTQHLPANLHPLLPALVVVHFVAPATLRCCSSARSISADAWPSALPGLSTSDSSWPPRWRRISWSSSSNRAKGTLPSRVLRTTASTIARAFAGSVRCASAVVTCSASSKPPLASTFFRIRSTSIS